MKKISFATALLALMMMSCGGNEKQQETTPQLVRTAKVTSASEIAKRQYPGRVKAATDADASFRLSGQIARILVKEGDEVRAGQTLAILDTTDYAVQLRATQAEYDGVKAQVDRVIALYNDSAVAKVEYDKAVTGLRQITEKLNHCKDQIRYTRLTAPIDGSIQKVHFKDNEIIGAGIPVVSLVSHNKLEVEINLPAAVFAKRNLFREFTCTFDIFGDKVYTLSQRSITPKANANQLYTMTLTLENQTPMPSAGMNTLVSIFYAQEGTEKLFVVPCGAVKSVNNQSTIFVLDENNVSREVSVRVVSVHTDGTATVESADIKIGDTVIASGVRFISNGQSVKPLEQTSNTNVGGLL